jgi:hypothetical protein
MAWPGIALVAAFAALSNLASKFDGETHVARTALGKADRFHRNPVLRDREWDQAKQAPWWLMILTIAIVGVAAYAGVYATGSSRTLGWIVVVAAIVLYLLLGVVRRRRARQELRRAHGQA